MSIERRTEILLNPDSMLTEKESWELVLCSLESGENKYIDHAMAKIKHRRSEAIHGSMMRKMGTLNFLASENLATPGALGAKIEEVKRFILECVHDI